ncbi:MAG TPA: zf-HC2 domain-containing protein [Terracidiphilus sp.]|jgi:anti-sigma factor RsiW|nr:zf-HC2 domain-containing protein [Terracidiphilus sp.]
MTEHLSPSMLSALADGELAADQLASVKEHLDQCRSCTSNALEQALLKTATQKSAQHYAIPEEFQKRMKRLVAQERARADAAKVDRTPRTASRLRPWTTLSGWAVAAVFLLVAGSWWIERQSTIRTEAVLAEQTALVTEVSDLHIATLAANLPPQVLSSDRHTVKPWFQGKIPFTFNLPEQLPDDTKLLGANLTYLHNQPIAQLMYSIGQHRVSVFIRAKAGSEAAGKLPAEHSGFQVAGFSTADLSVIAISDVDRSRLSGLIEALEQAQTNGHV